MWNPGLPRGLSLNAYHSSRTVRDQTAGSPLVMGLFVSSMRTVPSCCDEWLVNCAPMSVSGYHAHSYLGSPPAPCVPTKAPPFSSHVLKAARCASVSTSPLVLFQITSLKRPSCAAFMTAAFSVTNDGHPRFFVIAASAAFDAWIAGSSRYPFVFEKIRMAFGPLMSAGMSGGTESYTGVTNPPRARGGVGVGGCCEPAVVGGAWADRAITVEEIVTATAAIFKTAIL